MDNHSGSSAYFKNKLVLITGGSSGIGYALAQRLGEEGAELILVSNDSANLQQAVSSLESSGKRVRGIPCDIRVQDQVAAMGRQILSEIGCPDILINCAGACTYNTFEQATLDEIRQLADLDYAGALQCTKVFVNSMIERKSGQIVNISSIAGGMVLTPNAVYCGAKHGLLAWSECLRYELARFAIKVNVICPGRVNTHFFDHESFHRQGSRKVEKYNMSMDVLVKNSLKSIQKDRMITYIPGYFGLVAWALDAFPFILKPVYRRMMLARIEEIYKH